MGRDKANVIHEWWKGLTPVIDAPTEEQHWYTNYQPQKAIKHTISVSTIDSIQKQLETHFTKEVGRYHSAKRKNPNADDKWMNEVIKTGTLSDKVAALALKVQASPLHELETLDILIAMALKKEQRISQLALEALKDLLIHNLLPDRKLIPFKEQTLDDDALTLRSGLLMWYEDALATRVGRILDALDNGLKATVDYFKKLCMTLCLDLLTNKPEQELRLLVMLINKLGDNVGGACTKASQLLKTLLHSHPAMKVVVVKEIYLVPGDSEAAELLVETYIGLFEKMVAGNDSSSRLLAAVLNGINRSYPFLKDKRALQKHVDSLFRIVHVATFAASTQALLLISFLALGSDSNASGGDKKKKKQQSSEGEQEVVRDITDRYYRALYDKLQSDQIMSRARNTTFLNLLFRSVRVDTSDIRVAAFMKRICISATQASSPIAAGLLYLVSEICANRPAIIQIMTDITNEDLMEDKEAEYAQLGNYNALKREPEYACKGNPSLWELSLMRAHFHPSVAAFTHSLLTPPHKVIFDGDPIVEFSLSTFLNRFSYKNAKASKTKAIKSRVTNEEAINSSEFILSQEVAPDKAFFHKFFGARAALTKEGLVRDRSKKKHKAAEGDEEDEEEEMDRYADKLAEELMASAGDDPDMDDDDDEDFEEGEEDEEFSIGDEFKAEYAGGADDEEEDDDEEVGRVADFDDFEDSADVLDADEEEDYELAAYGDEDEEEIAPAVTKSKKVSAPQQVDSEGKKRKKEGASDFADAAEYEEIMEEIMQFHNKNKEFGGDAATKDYQQAKQGTKGKRIKI